MVVSDARSADDFRAEVIAEISRRQGDLSRRIAHAAYQRKRGLAAASEELGDLAAFLLSIELRDHP